MPQPPPHHIARTAITLFLGIAMPAASQTINEDLKLTASDAATADNFGSAIAIDNGIVAVGMYLDDENGTNSGSAYLFDASTGKQLFKLLPDDGDADDWFGYSIAIDNGIVAVGAHKHNDNGIDSGSAYLFNASSGMQIFKLLPSDGAEGDGFGKSIDIDNGVVAIGSMRDDDNGTNSGSAYLFDAYTGTQLLKLIPNEDTAYDNFGWSISIDNGIVAVGSLGDDANGPDSGSAYLFDASVGTQLFKLLPSDGTAFDNFGSSIAIDNGIVAVGANRDDDNGGYSGSAYLFDANTGDQSFKLSPSDSASDDYFGYSIAIDNGIVAVGSRINSVFENRPGSAYLFDASTGVQISKLLHTNGVAGDWFGYSIAINANAVAVGATGTNNGNGPGSGSVYLYSPSVLCSPDLANDGALNFLDVSAFLSAFGAQDSAADFQPDGNFNFLDVSAFLAAFGAGCP